MNLLTRRFLQQVVDFLSGHGFTKAAEEVRLYSMFTEDQQERYHNA